MDNYSHNSLQQEVQKLRRGDDVAFLAVAKKVYELQRRACLPYGQWVDTVLSQDLIQNIVDIPRLHISAFKCARVSCLGGPAKAVFTSSGTSGSTTSKHFVYDKDWYLQNSVAAYESFYASVADTCILGLLPSYLERTGSSLVAMVDHFVRISSYSVSGTYLHDHEQLYEVLHTCKRKAIPTLLIGVSFGLLDFVESYSIDFPGLIVMETGGMKGRREEMTRIKLHDVLREGFGVAKIHSEYGMTELLSQAYSQGDGLFHCPATMRIVVTDINDPLSIVDDGKAGIINIVDLANIDSCSFLMTDDLGILHSDGTFEVIGRVDQSDVRGCNLLVSDLG